MNMKRVLQVVYNMSICGGIQSFIMNVYKNIDKQRVQFDFLLCEHSDFSYEEEIKELGGNIYFISSRKQGVIKNKIDLNRFFKNHKYDIVHYHSDSLSNVEPLIAARNNDVQIRIMHCHNTNITSRLKMIYMFLHMLNKKRIDKIATNYLACSKKAREWAYGGTRIYNDAQVINNCIDISKFTNDEIKENELRNKLGISKDNFVLCHTGRFEKVKNHEFILDVFNKIKEKNNKAVLILVGNGTLYENIINKIQTMNLQSSVKCLGIREDINTILRISNAFIYPSLYEGLGISILEAEATGLPCIISDKVPDDAVINDNVIKLSLNDTSQKWADCVLNNKKTKNNKLLIDKIYDINNTINELKKIYKLS